MPSEPVRTGYRAGVTTQVPRSHGRRGSADGTRAVTIRDVAAAAGVSSHRIPGSQWEHPGEPCDQGGR